MPPSTSLVPREVWHPGARPGCATCDGSGLALAGDPVAASVCACVATCPRCCGGGFLAGGLEICACRLARERAELLSRATLPAPAELPTPAPLRAWFAAYRPESGRAWLLAHGPWAAAVPGELIRLSFAIGAPVHRAGLHPTAEWSRLVCAFELHTWARPAIEALVSTCERRGLTLVATCDLPAPLASPLSGADALAAGLEAALGPRAAAAFFELALLLPDGA